MANIRIKRSHIALRKVCGKKDNAAFFAEWFEGSGSNDNQMRSLRQDKGVVERQDLKKAESKTTALRKGIRI